MIELLVPSRGFLRRHVILVVAAATVVLLAAVGVVVYRASTRHVSADSRVPLVAASRAPGISVPVVSPTERASSPTVIPSASSTGNPIGTALQITVNSANSQGGTDDIAFPSSLDGKIPTFVGRYQAVLSDQQSGGSLDGVLTDALTSGAYSYRSSVLQLQLSDPSDRTVTVYSIRPIVTQRAPIATGGVISYAVGAGPTDRIDFDLDSPDPLGREDVSGKTSSPPYFPNKTIDVHPGTPHNLDLKFSAEAGI